MRSIALFLMLTVAAGISAATQRATVPAEQAPTFSAAIAPILHANCVTCHRPGEAAPLNRDAGDACAR